MRFPVIGKRLFHFFLFQVQIAQHQLVTGFHRIFGRQFFNLFESLSGLFQLAVQLIFLHGKRFVHPHGRFQGVVGLDRFGRFSLLGERIGQVIIQFRLFGISFHQFFKLFGRFSVHAQVAGNRGERHFIGEVIPAVGHGAFEHIHGFVGPVELDVKRR